MNPSRAAIEQYVLQVHELEKHTAELHTLVTSLKALVKEREEESESWKCVANERLQTIEQLRQK